MSHNFWVMTQVIISMLKDQRKQEAKIKRQQELAKIHNKFEMAVDYH